MNNQTTLTVGEKQYTGNQVTWLFENMIEMSRLIQIMLNNPQDYKITDDIDSRDFNTFVPQWAMEFEALHPEANWDTEDPHSKYIAGYYDMVEKFTIEKMQSQYGTGEPPEPTTDGDKYLVCFALYGSVSVNAKDHETARELVESMSIQTLARNDLDGMEVTSTTETETQDSVGY